ncbi:hypothetical protein MNBD_PLANCTO02-1452, partial [hydrothermal vent metagenome]
DFGLVVPHTPEFCKPGNRTGTAAYMAPELLRRKKTDQRLDIFSYAITCFEMYTQEFPWPGIQTMEASRQRINTPPRDIRELASGIHEKIAQTIMKGLETEPNDRWQSISEMLQQFINAETAIKKDSLKKENTSQKKTVKKKKKRTKKKESEETQTSDEDDVFDQFISEVTQEANDEERKAKSVRKKKTRKKKKKKSKRKRSTKGD